MTRGSHGERCHVCQTPTGHRNTDGVPELETNHLSAPSEIRKMGLTIELLESQTGKTDVTKSRQPWERSSIFCEHTRALSSQGAGLLSLGGRCWALPSSSSLRVPPHQCGEAEPALQREAPAASTLWGHPCRGQCRQRLAAAMGHSGLRGWHGGLSSARTDREVHPNSTHTAAALGAAIVTFFVAS